MKLPLVIVAAFLSSVSASAAAENFGRLFTSPEERRALDGLKLNQQINGSALPAEPIVLPTPVVTNAPSEVRFSGFIRRSDGTYAIWINGLSELSGANLPIESARFSKNNDATLVTTGQQAAMKPGQIWSLESNTIREGYYIERDIEREIERGIEPILPGTE